MEKPAFHHNSIVWKNLKSKILNLFNKKSICNVCESYFANLATLYCDVTSRRNLPVTWSHYYYEFLRVLIPIEWIELENQYVQYPAMNKI